MKRYIATSLLATALLGAIPATALAHATATAETTSAGAYSYVRFGIGHGCEKAGTTSVTIKVPQEEYVFSAVTPYLNPNWKISVKEGKLKEAVELHGEEQTEGVTEVTYTKVGPALPTDQGDSLFMTIKLPDDAEGETIYFPVVQQCEDGNELAWIEIPQEGEDPHELESPAPAIMVTEAAGEHGDKGDAHAAEADMSKYATDAHVHTHTDRLYWIAGIALALAGLSLLLVLFRGRGRNG